MNRRLIARHIRVRDEADGTRDARKRSPRFLGLVGLHGDRGKVDGGGAGRQQRSAPLRRDSVYHGGKGGSSG